MSGAYAQDQQKMPTTFDDLREIIKTQLPAPPEGFAWQQFKNAVFQKPIAWTEQRLDAKIFGMTRTVYATSPEKFSTTKPFEMGMTLEILSGPKKTMNMDPETVAIALIKPIFDSHKKEEILIQDQKKTGDFDMIFLRYRDAPAGLKPIIVHKFILANNVADSVHTFTFESPAETWDANWSKYGTPIISKLSVVPTIPSN
jgi:hypothetical protein